jgi:hypothetical protein
MLQEEGQTVGFSPADLGHYFPWYVKLLLCYLLFVSVFAIVGSVGLAWEWYKLRNSTRKPEASPFLRSQVYWELWKVRAKSCRNLSHLTILLSVLVLAISLCNALDAVATQKFAGGGALAWAAEDALIPFSWGMIDATVLFCVAHSCEHLIRQWNPFPGGWKSYFQERLDEFNR